MKEGNLEGAGEREVGWAVGVTAQVCQVAAAMVEEGRMERAEAVMALAAV